jgi:hypothetical protein
LQLIAISGFELAEADLDVIDLGGVITADESEVRSTDKDECDANEGQDRDGDPACSTF